MLSLTASTTGRVAVQQLRDEGAGLVWAANGLASVRQALTAELDGPHAGAAIDDLLRLMVVLRDVRGAPDAAAALADTVRAVPGALRVVRRRHIGVGGIDQLRTFAQREGRSEALRAPTSDVVVPDGAMPLKNMLDPTDRDRARAIARRRKEIQDGRG